jgi:hypothetical protein
MEAESVTPTMALQMPILVSTSQFCDIMLLLSCMGRQGGWPSHSARIARKALTGFCGTKGQLCEHKTEATVYISSNSHSDRTKTEQNALSNCTSCTSTVQTPSTHMRTTEY